MRARTFVFITALLACHPSVFAQRLTKQFPPAAVENAAATDGHAGLETPSDGSIPEAPGYPIAEVVPAPPSGVPVRFEYDHMEKHGSVYTLTGEVRIDYRDYILFADKVVFDQQTSIAQAQGHVKLQGGPDNELINADSGMVNFDQNTGRFLNVVGSIAGRKPQTKRKVALTTPNPFLFTGREVIKQGAFSYRVIDGTMTSCSLPKPDWQILSARIDVADGKARARNAYFKFFGVPILYMPYVEHPVNTEARQSGLLIPVIGNSSTKGLVLGEQIYWSINRSMDATFGTQYFSLRGWSPSGEFRYHGLDENFAAFHFIALFDRGAPQTGLNQGGQDITFSGRKDFYPDGHTRAVATGEYLSSYVYRQAFAESFTSAVASEVTSSIFLTHSENGFSESLDFDRYQNFQGITQVGNTYITPEIRISRLPSLDVDAQDRHIETTPVVWGFDGSLAAVSRSEPGLSTGEVGRFDFSPYLALPFHADGWNFRPEVSVRETFYTQSQIPTSTVPLVSDASVNRKDVEASFEIRPPVLVRDFNMPWLERFLGSDVRHTLEPDITYRYVSGIDNFQSVPRFDAIDVASDTNELDYSLTQRLFLKHLHPKPCTDSDLPPAVNGVIYVPSTYKECGGDTDAWITWTLAAKYFFDPTFGGAVSPFRPNVLDTTLDLTGVAFLEGPRNYSPIVSRMQLRTNRLIDLEWDTSYDTKTGRWNANNIFADYRNDHIFGSVGYSTLNALNPTFTSIPSSQVTQYNLLRLLFGFGDPTKPGLSGGAEAGYDYTENAWQYYTVQATYNWNCCGISFGYRRLALGAVRNESQPMFSFTLAGVGSAGTLKQAERIY